MAANYDLPSVVEKRVRFFDGQYLYPQDFIDEQKYQLDRERRPNRLLHVSGIAEGLAVVAGDDANQVTVGAGTAVDADGRQLVLAGDTVVDLPGERFNNSDAVRLYVVYRESAEDRQAEEGSADYTRWLEKPQLLALLSGEDYQGEAPPVLLATLALNGSGNVTVEPGVRQYSGVRLPGPTAEGATLRTGADRRVRLDATLTVDGDVGIGTSEPTHKLSVNGRMSIEHGVIQRGGNLITGTSHLGLYSLYDEDPIRLVTYRGPIRFFTDGGAGKTPHMSVEPDGNVGVGTTQPKAKLEVRGAGGTNVDLLVNGRLQSSHPDGGLWVGAADAGGWFVGGHSLTKFGFYHGVWRLTVDADGNVGIGTTEPTHKLSVNGRLNVAGGVIQRGGAAITKTSDLGLYSQIDSYWIRLVTSKAPIRFFTDGGAGTVPQMSVEANGNVGVGTTVTDGPNAKLEVRGGGGLSVDLLVNGRLRSDNDDGGLWVASDRFVGGHSGNQIGIWNNNAWRISVNDVGDVGIGTTNPTHKLGVNGRMSVEDGVIQRGGDPVVDTSDLGLYSQLSDNWIRIVTNKAPIKFFTDGGIGTEPAMTIDKSNNVVAHGGLFVTGTLAYYWGPENAWKHIQNRGGGYAGSYNTGGPSDIRLKTALRPINDAIGAVLRLQGTRYRWGEDGVAYFTKDIPDTLLAGPDATEEDNRRLWETKRREAAQALSGDRIGLVAQDVEAVVPEVVHTDEDGYKHIRYGQLTALLVEAVKEQHAEVAALSGRVATLEGREGSPSR